MTTMLTMPLIATTVAHEVRAKGAPAAPITRNDRYTPGRIEQAPVNYGQVVAATAKTKGATKADVLASVKAGDYKKLEQNMMTMTASQRLDALEDLRKHHGKEYQHLLADVRAGKVESNMVKTGVAIDKLSTTKWAQKGEGKDILKHLESQYNAGQIVARKELGGFGQSDALIPNAGRNGAKSPTLISVHQDVTNSPETLAAILAHEGQHSLRTNNGAMKSTFHEELDANMVGVRVWNEFGSEKDAATNGAAAQFRKMSGYSEFQMANFVARAYTSDYFDKGQNASARGVLTDWILYDGNNGFKVAGAMSAEEREQLARLMDRGGKAGNAQALREQ